MKEGSGSLPKDEHSSPVCDHGYHSQHRGHRMFFDLIPYFTCDALDNNTQLYILMKNNLCMSNMSRLGHAKREYFDPQEIGPLEFWF